MKHKCLLKQVIKIAFCLLILAVFEQILTLSVIKPGDSSKTNTTRQRPKSKSRPKPRSNEVSQLDAEQYASSIMLNISKREKKHLFL